MTMVTYVVLTNFTDQGIRNAKDSPKRADAFKQMAKTFGVTVKDIFWTQGRYDIVTIVEAPDEASAMSLNLSLGALGNVRTESLRAFSAADMATVVGKMIWQRTLLAGIRRTATAWLSIRGRTNQWSRVKRLRISLVVSVALSALHQIAQQIRSHR
jgi:uncharacterized protein with GYD domain